MLKGGFSGVIFTLLCTFHTYKSLYHFLPFEIILKAWVKNEIKAFVHLHKYLKKKTSNCGIRLTEVHQIHWSVLWQGADWSKMVNWIQTPVFVYCTFSVVWHEETQVERVTALKLSLSSKTAFTASANRQWHWRAALSNPLRRKIKSKTEARTPCFHQPWSGLIHDLNPSVDAT